jgi:hypothetical protein
MQMFRIIISGTHFDPTLEAAASTSNDSNWQLLMVLGGKLWQLGQRPRSKKDDIELAQLMETVQSRSGSMSENVYQIILST